MASSYSVEDITEDLAKTSIQSEWYAKDSYDASQEDTLLFDPRKYTEEELPRRLQQFFETSLPSKVKRSDGVGRIRALSFNYEDEELGDYDGLTAAWERMKESAPEDINPDSIKNLAREYGVLGGIWLLHYHKGTEADKAWEKIVRATVAGKLGTHAKVTPTQDTKEGGQLHGNYHCISVYTQDYTDKEAVLATEAALRKLGLTIRFLFKPRIYSSIGIYRHNQWRVRPSIYVSNWNAAEGKSDVTDQPGSPK